MTFVFRYKKEYEKKKFEKLEKKLEKKLNKSFKKKTKDDLENSSKKPKVMHFFSVNKKFLERTRKDLGYFKR